MSAPGSKPASKMAPQLDQPFLVRLERRPVAALVGDALERAALREALSCRGIDLCGPLQRLAKAAGADADDHVVLDVASSRRRALRRRRSGSAAPAATPALSPASFFHRGACGPRHRRARRRATPPPWHLRRGALLSAVPSRSISRRSIFSWSETLSARSPSRMRVWMPPHRFARVHRLRLAGSGRGARRGDRASRRERRGAAPNDHLRPRPSDGRASPRPGALYVEDFCHASRSCFRVEATGNSSRARDRPHLLSVAWRYSTGDLPSTASSRAGSRAAQALFDARKATLLAGKSLQGRRSRRGTRLARGTQRHLSSRWFRQKARSKAGSPYQAHSASRNTGPAGRPGCSSGSRRRAPGTAVAVRALLQRGELSSGAMRVAGREQVGLEADGVEDRVGGERSATSARRPWRRGWRERGADLRGEGGSASPWRSCSFHTGR